MKIKLLTPFLFLALSLSSLQSHARRMDRERPPGGHGGGGGMRQMFEDLNLTKEQKEKLKELRKKEKDSMKALRESSKAAREKLQQAFQNDASEDQLKAAHSEMQEARNKTANARFANLLEIRKILTPEQRKKFGEMHARKKGKWNKGRRGGPDADDEGEDGPPHDDSDE